MTRARSRKLKLTLSALLAPALALGLAACGSSGGGGTSTNTGNATSANSSANSSGSTSGAKHGGSVVDLLGSSYAGNWPSGLDPATNTTGAANLPQQQAVFGGLFLLEADNDGLNGHIVPNQAASGALSPDAKTLTIKLRPGIKFSDGTPMDAQSLIWNFTRDSKSACTCAPKWVLRKQDPFTSPDSLTVQVHFSAPNAAILHAFPASNANWIASPTAYKKMGEKAFSLNPVGAGPFTVVSDTLNTKLVVKRNPNYFDKNLPYLDQITFQSIDGEQAAYQAMLAGAADAYEGASNPSIIAQAEKNPKIQVTTHPGVSPYMVQVNTRVAPFNNIKAREALYYAADWAAINQGLYGGKQKIVQGFTTPADLYYHETVPGYRTYDLAKAKALVKELGGLSFKLEVIARLTPTEVTTALQTQFKKAGMQVSIKTYQLGALIKRYNSAQWNAILTVTGAWDPAAGSGLGLVFSSTSSSSGVHDPKLDKLLAQSVATSNDSQRDQIYQQIAKYVSDQAYGTFGFAVGQTNWAVKGLTGPGLTTKIPALAVESGVIWGQVSKD
jgi:peptide/nickel transport system substrate-binding protein